MTCWRDDVHMPRTCIACGEHYYGDLGHRGCKGWRQRPAKERKREGILTDREVLDAKEHKR